MSILALAAALPSTAYPQTPARAVPYAKLASALATPVLVDSAGPRDKSLLKLRFVSAGQSETQWLKMTSISIAKVKPGDTRTATRSIIAKFKASLESQKHATVKSFVVSTLEPTNAFFEFSTSDGVAEQGVAYSPADGFVSVVQVAYKRGYVRGAADRDVLKSLLTQR